MKEYFFDIETTNLKADSGRIVAIGLKEFRGDFILFFGEDEKSILEEFVSFLREDFKIIGFNINNFDIPYLKYKCFFYRINFSIVKKITFLDLFEIVNYSFKDVLSQKKLSSFKKILNIEDSASSREIGNIFIEYLKTRDENIRNSILEHLKSDLISTEKLYVSLLESGLI